MTNHLFDALLRERATDDRPLLVLADGTRWSYRETASTAARMATVLAGLGAGPGDRLVVQVEKSAEALALYFACLKAGVVLVPLNTAYTPAEVEDEPLDEPDRLLVPAAEPPAVPA